MTIQEALHASPGEAFNLNEVRPGLFQLIAPIFHEDGDMMTIFLEERNDKIHICDQGMSLMRLSYHFDIDSDKKKKILNQLIAARGGEIDEGNIYIEVEPSNVFSGIMTFSQLVTEVCAMNMLSRENVEGIFYESLSEIISEMRIPTSVKRSYFIPETLDYKADYAILPNSSHTKPIYIFGIKDTNKAQQTTICCLQLALKKTPFRSVVIFDNMDSLSRTARNSLINVAGKIYSDLSSFEKSGEQYILDELGETA